LHEHVTVETVTGEKHQIDVVINGTNDKPTIDTMTARQVNEGGKSISGHFSAHDVDHGDSLTYGLQSGATAPPGFTVHSDGSYTFDPSNPHYAQLAHGTHQVLNIPISVTDGHGGTDTQMLQITVTGTNAAPTASANVDLGQTKEDTAKSFTAAGLLSAAHAADVDHDNLFINNLNVNSKYGHINDDGHGHFVFTPALNFHGDNIPITYQVTDGLKSVTVHGTLDVLSVNDAPVVRNFYLGRTREDTDKSFTAHDLLRHASDVDHDTLTLQGTPTVDAKYGTISGDAVHGFVFHPKPNFHGNSVPIQFHVTDGHLSTLGTARINVSSVADPAVITEVTTDHAVEDTKNSATGQLHVTDGDGARYEHFQASSHMPGH